MIASTLMVRGCALAARDGAFLARDGALLVRDGATLVRVAIGSPSYSQSKVVEYDRSNLW
jgi:hypothetical protein